MNRKVMKESINTTTVGGQFKANGRAGGDEENKQDAGRLTLGNDH